MDLEDLLSLSSLRYFYFKPMQIYQQNLSKLFLAFVKNADVRHDVLKWIGDCLVENQGQQYISFVEYNTFR